MKRLLLLLFAVSLVIGCDAQREPSAEYEGEPWASLRELGDGFQLAAEVGESGHAAGNDRENADGGIYLANIAFNQFQRTLFTDPDYPVFRPQYPESGYTGLVNPDNLYERASIRGGVDYLVRGTRGTTSDVVFQVYAGSPGVKGELRDVGTLSLDDIEFTDDGSFEIYVGPTPHPKNWIQTDAGAGLLLIRWSHSDWDSERVGRAEIVRVGAEGQPSPDRDVGDVSRRIQEAAAAIPDAGQFWLDFTSKARLFVGQNSISGLRKTGNQGLQGQVSAMGRFALADDEVLVLTVPKADTRYQGLQLGNGWFDALEWANRQTSLSAGQSHLGSDGRYHYVVSEKDPGVPNWLDTTGVPEGVFFLRFQGLRTPIPDEQAPSVQLVKLAEIRDHLPPDTPVMGPEERRQQLAGRQLQIQRRYGR